MRVPAPLLCAAASALVLEACEGCVETDVNAKPDEAPAFTNDAGSWLSMATTDDGKPAIAYYDRTQDGLGYAVATVDKAGAATWTREEVDSYPDENGLNPGDAGRYASMAIGSNGQVWIAYQDSTNGTLKYAHKGDGVWDVAVADVGGGSKSDAGFWASLALDSSGNPVVAHYDHGKGNLRVAHYNGSAFTGEVAAEGEAFTPADTGAGAEVVEANVGEYAKLYIGSDGTEYIAYYDRTMGALRLATGKSGGYTVTTVDDDGDVGEWPSIAMDGSTLWIAYHDVANQDLKVAHGTPGDFTVETVDTGEHVGADTAMFLDGGSPGIVYFDGFGNDMKLAKARDGAWTTETVTGSQGALGYHNETVRIGDTRYVACYDFTARAVFFSALP
ncbi:hypothetical protein LBMAG42_12630 [Deltaproteobacteria bacterium]|nr:hypothetical protein LBMAG42_12630 [Deltaproteobacteria bacterium]